MNQNDYLAHYGVRGMRWGVRRYQNYDGSYTREGLRRYNESERYYNEQLDKVKSTKELMKESTGSDKEALRSRLQKEKGELKIRKNDLKADYKQLKKDMASDKGKALYQQGKTITTNRKIQAAAVVAPYLVTKAANLAISKAFVDGKMNDSTARITSHAIAIGSSIVSDIVIGKKYIENRNMASYIYRGSRPKHNSR